MRLQAILFDLWGTLIHDTPDRGRPRQAWRAVKVRDVLAEHHLDHDFYDVMKALDAATMALTQLHDTGRDTDSAGRVQLFLDKLEAATGKPVPAEVMPGIEAVITSMPRDFAPTAAASAIDTLAAVKRLGLRTALISNVGITTSPHLRDLLTHHYGFAPYFDSLVFSDELLIAKPDAAIFRHALDSLGLAAADCAFIGDAPHNDVYGAQQAGLFTVQIGDKGHGSVRPQARIDDLSELLPALAAHGLLTPVVAG